MVKYSPEIKFAFSNLSVNPKNIQDKTKVLASLQESEKSQLADSVAQTLTIKQRIAITNLLSKADFGDSGLDQIKRVFGSTNLYILRAELDVFLILGHIAE